MCYSSIYVNKALRQTTKRNPPIPACGVETGDPVLLETGNGITDRSGNKDLIFLKNTYLAVLVKLCAFVGFRKAAKNE